MNGGNLISLKYRSPDAPVLVNKWALVGPNLLVLPKCLELAQVVAAVVVDASETFSPTLRLLPLRWIRYHLIVSRDICCSRR